MAEAFRQNTAIDDGTDVLDIRRVVARAKQGDPEAIRSLYVRYADNVYGYVLSIVRDAHDAEDITQKVFERVVKSISRYETRSVPFAAWILRVARNLAIDHVRRKREILSPEVRAASSQSWKNQVEARAALRSALADLPFDQREVVVLRHVIGLTPTEIAERLGKSEAAVHGLHHRGRRQVRESLVKMGSQPAMHRTAA